MCSGSEAGSYLRLIDFVHHSTPNPTTGAETRVAMLLTGVAGCSLSIASMSLGKFASATAISLAGNFNRVRIPLLLKLTEVPFLL